jgi:mRNA-degrading endonuclease RelE of RelBE toxin-antitoxin system
MTRRAQREVNTLGRRQRAAVLAEIAGFAQGETSVDVRRLQGHDPPRWRLRVGRYRVIYALEPGQVIVERVLDRRDAYR